MSGAYLKINPRDYRNSDTILDAFRRTRVYSDASPNERQSLETYLQELGAGEVCTYRDAVLREKN